jgi:uncharacterized protein (DUF2384 family)
MDADGTGETTNALPAAVGAGFALRASLGASGAAPLGSPRAGPAPEQPARQSPAKSKITPPRANSATCRCNTRMLGFHVQMELALANTTLHKAGVLSKALLRAADSLSVPTAVLARIVGSSEASLSRVRNGKRQVALESKEGELALLFLRVFRSLDALVGGNQEQARAWLHAPNEHLSGIPLERMQKVEGLVDVAEYLDAMRGAF